MKRENWDKEDAEEAEEKETKEEEIVSYCIFLMQKVVQQCNTCELQLTLFITWTLNLSLCACLFAKVAVDSHGHIVPVSRARPTR